MASSGVFDAPRAGHGPEMGGAGRVVDRAPRDGLCVSKAFSLLLGWEVELGADPDFDRLPTELCKYSRKFILQKPVKHKWAYPGLLLDGGGGRIELEGTWKTSTWASVSALRSISNTCANVHPSTRRSHKALDFLLVKNHPLCDVSSNKREMMRQ